MPILNRCIRYFRLFLFAILEKHTQKLHVHIQDGEPGVFVMMIAMVKIQLRNINEKFNGETKKRESSRILIIVFRFRSRQTPMCEHLYHTRIARIGTMYPINTNSIIYTFAHEFINPIWSFIYKDMFGLFLDGIGMN